MNHQPFFALLKVKLNSVCHKKIIDCLQKKARKKLVCQHQQREQNKNK